MKIIPAVLPKTFSELSEAFDAITGFVPLAQIDICDGQFVASHTWPYKKSDDTFDAILREEQGLPHWQDLDCEIDLMVKDPEKYVHDWITAGATRIILHVESSPDLFPSLKILEGIMDVGIALNVDTPLESIAQYADSVSFVQCMGIRTIGLQGQPFDPAVLVKIQEIKKRYPNLAVHVDGGVTLDVARTLKGEGVDAVAVGSAIFASENPIESLLQFKALS